MRGRNPENFGQSLSPRGKRVLALVGVALVAVFAAVGIWTSVHHSTYGASRDGCVNVNVPSSMGGSYIHACGGQARTLCRNAYQRRDKVSGLVRPQCQLAGLSAAVLNVASPAATP
jgi:hypothetical protein